MRRCPQCEFFYEDDENLCAMDGTELVNYRGPLPFEESSPSRTPARRNFYGRSLTLITAGAILAVASILFFQTVGKRRVPQSSFQTPLRSSTASPRTEQTPAAAVPEPNSILIPDGSSNSVARAKTKAITKVDPDRQSDRDPFSTAPVASSTPLLKPSPIFSQAHASTAAPPINSVTPVAKQREPALPSQPAVSSPSEIKPAATSQKSESKISSFLKRTGRALKKPFKH
jgi:hypothetical protein